jgi:hypothetical protein
MRSELRTKPLGRATSALVDEDGLAFACPTTAIVPRQVKVFVDAAAYIGWGTDDSPDAATTSNTVYQEGGTEVVYTYNGTAALDPSHIWVYAVSTSVALTTRLSWFG